MAGRRRCAVVGHPVHHSLSPVMHQAAYEALSLDWTYEALDVPADGLPELVRGLEPAWRGLSVTAPHKRDALTLADTTDEVAAGVGVANTLVLDGAGAVRAHNTDVPGAVAALAARGVPSVERVRILGGGATATSMAVAAASTGARWLELCVRDPARAEAARLVAEGLGLTVVVRPLDAPIDAGAADPVDLLVSTVPAGAVQERADDLAAGAEVVFDVVYDPWPTPLARAAQEAGRTVVTGLDLLAHQAVLQVRLMCGAEVPVEVLRAAAVDELDRRAASAP